MGKLEISSRKLEIPRESFQQRWVPQKRKTSGTQQKHRRLRRDGKNT